MNKLIFFLISFFLFACSHQEINDSSPKVYSDESKNFFEHIENIDHSIPKTTTDTSARMKTVDEINRSQTPNTPSSPTSNPTPETINHAVQVSAPVISRPGSEERKKEIQQNLVYYCFKHRQDARYKSEKDCIEKVNIVLQTCESEFKIVNVEMVRCVKEGLKKQ